MVTVLVTGDSYDHRFLPSYLALLLHMLAEPAAPPVLLLMQSAPTITPGLDSVDAATVELLDAILHVAARPGCTLAYLNRYVSDLRDKIAVPAPTGKLQLVEI